MLGSTASTFVWVYNTQLVRVIVTRELWKRRHVFLASSQTLLKLTKTNCGLLLELRLKLSLTLVVNLRLWLKRARCDIKWWSHHLVTRLSSLQRRDHKLITPTYSSILRDYIELLQVFHPLRSLQNLIITLLGFVHIRHLLYLLRMYGGVKLLFE